MKPFILKGMVYRRQVLVSDKYRRLLLALMLTWFLFIHVLFYLTIVRDKAPGLLDRLGLEWLR